MLSAFGNFNPLSVRLVNTFRRLRASGAKAYLMFARLRINTNSEFTFYQTDNQNLNKNFQISSVNRSILKNYFRQKPTPEISGLVDHCGAYAYSLPRKNSRLIKSGP